MAEREYELAKSLRLFRSAAQRAADEQAERIALDHRLWPTKAKKAKVGKGLPRALSDLHRRVVEDQVWPPTTPLYAHNRVVSYSYGRPEAVADMGPDDARTAGREARASTKAGLAAHRPKPRVSDVHAANAERYRAARMERVQQLEGAKVVAAAEKILRRRLP